MLDETKVDETKAPPTGDETTTPPTGDETLTPDQMVAQMLETRGGLPKAPEGEEGEEVDPDMQLMKEQIFKLTVERDLEKVQRIIESKIPDASDQQSFAVAKAIATGDVAAIVDAIISAQKTAMEKDEKDEDLKTLHVEGGGSGKDDKETTGGMAELFEKIADTYSQPA